MAVAGALQKIDPNWKDKVPSELLRGPTLQDWLLLGDGAKPYSDGPSLADWLLIAKGDPPRYKDRSLKDWLDGYIQGLSALKPLSALTSERLTAQTAVQGIGTNAIPWLLTWLQSNDANDARLARGGFSFLGEEAHSGLAALIELAQSPTPEIRHRALGCIHALALDWDHLWAAMLPALHHPDVKVREDAATFLLECYPTEAEATDLPELLGPG